MMCLGTNEYFTKNRQIFCQSNFGGNNLSCFETNVPILWKLDGLRPGVMQMFRECFLMTKKHRKNM